MPSANDLSNAHQAHIQVEMTANHCQVRCATVGLIDLEHLGKLPQAFSAFDKAFIRCGKRTEFAAVVHLKTKGDFREKSVHRYNFFFTTGRGRVICGGF
jgi:hypothetical protein